jgi:acyl-CoA thioester hydrolase
VSETDIGGVTYHANYFIYSEHARSELFKEIEFDQMKLVRDEHKGFMVAEVNAVYKAPSTLDDVLTIHTSISDVSDKKLIFTHQIYKNSRFEDPIAIVTARLVCVDSNIYRPTSIPEFLKTKLTKFSE